MEEIQQNDWIHPIHPTYNFSVSPELSSKLDLGDNDDLGLNFPRLAKWSPDGSIALAQCENRSFQFIQFPSDIVKSLVQNHQLPTEVTESHPSPTSTQVKVIRQAAPILDYIWYPSASPQVPASYCFVASVRECPVKLLDASDGRLRASYKIVDHRERQIAPHSLAFNLYGDKLYCGFQDAIEVFNVGVPGEGSRIHTIPTKKSKDGLKGIISALAFCPSYDSANYFAAGSLSPSSSYSSNIALYTEDTDGIPVGFLSVNGAGGGVRAAVTQLQFNPTSPHLLYASFRRHDCIYSWDLRGDMSIPLRIFRYGQSRGSNGASVEMTNQRSRFDIDPSGRWLSVGDQRGNVSMFDVGESLEVSNIDGTPETAPTLQYCAHDDAIGSVGFHPSQSLLLSVSGSRHFHHDQDTLSSADEPHDVHSDFSSESSFDSDEGEDSQPKPRQSVKHSFPHPFPLDASIRLWDLNRQ